jgi:hypothetical protein
MSQKNLSERAKQMHGLIRQYLASGLTQKKFFENESLPRSTFLYWLQHFRKYEKSGQSAFIPLNIKGSPVNAVLKGQVCIEYPTGIFIRFDHIPDSEVLLRLIQTGDV